MPFTLPVAFFSQDSSNTIDYTVTYSISPDVGTFSSTSALSQDGTKSISADGITFQSNNSNVVADCAKIQLDTDLDEYRDVTVTLTITDGIKTKTVTKVITGVSAFSVSNLNQTIFTNEDVNPTVTTMVVTDGSDVSATGDVTATITNSDPLAATLSSSAGTYNSTTGVYTITDSIANVNTALAALTVSLTANFNGDFSLTTAFNDTGSVHTASGEIDITVSSVNDAPSWSNVINYNYNDANSTFTFNGPNVADVDNDAITMTAALQDSIGTLSSTEAGVTQNNNQTLIAVGLPATVNNVLDNLTFNRTGTGASSIEFYANDGTSNVNATASLFFGATLSSTISSISSMDGGEITSTYHLSPDIILTNSSVTSTGIKTEVPVSSNISSTATFDGPTLIILEKSLPTNINATGTATANTAMEYAFKSTISATGSVSANVALQNVNFSGTVSATSSVPDVDFTVHTLQFITPNTISSTGSVSSVQVRPARFKDIAGITSSSSATVSLSEFLRNFTNDVDGVLDQIDSNYNTYELTSSGFSKKLFQSNNSYASATSKSISGITDNVYNMSVSDSGNTIGIRFPDYDNDPTFGQVLIYEGTGATDSASSYTQTAGATSTDDSASYPWPNRVMAIRDDIAIFTHHDGSTHRWYKKTKSGGTWGGTSSGLTISNLGANAKYAVSPDGSNFVQVATTSSSTALQYHEDGVKVGEIFTVNLPSSGTNYSVDKLVVLDDGTIFANMPVAGEVVVMDSGSTITVDERIAHSVTTGVTNALLDMHVSSDGRYVVLLIDDDSPDTTVLQVWFKGATYSSYTKVHEKIYTDNRVLSGIELATTRTQDDALTAVIADIPTVGKRLHK